VSDESGIDLARLGRTLTLIGFVTAVFLLLAVNRLSGEVFRVGVVGIGAVAFVTAIVGFLVAAVSAFDSGM
jgi:ABC-type enterobactin transport system permease subunit